VAYSIRGSIGLIPMLTQPANQSYPFLDSFSIPIWKEQVSSVIRLSPELFHRLNAKDC
jgi:hypothetical protein